MRLKLLLSNRCNFLCDYCVVRVNEDEPLYLDAPALRRAVDHYLAGVEHLPDAAKGVSYGGGEPLLKPELALDCASYVRRRAPGVRQDLHTNGALLTRPLYEALRAEGVYVVVSIDGGAEAHDRHRAAYGGGGKRTWRSVVARLRGLPLPEMGANLVFAPDTVDGLPENVETLRAMGFRHVAADPDVCHAGRLCGWDRGGLERLSRASRRMAGYVAGAGGRTELAWARLREPRSYTTAGDGLALDSIFLGADGRFYPPGLQPFPYDALEPYRCGDARAGVDWEKLAAFEREAAGFVLRHFGPDRAFHFPPLADYLYARCAGDDPRSLIERHLKVYETMIEPLPAP